MRPTPCGRAALAGAAARSSPGELAAISADQARVVVLKDALDWSFEEISSRSGMPVGTAKCYAHRGRELAARAARARMTPSAPFGRDVIETIIPHRDPFLFLDEVLELEPGVRVVARKQVPATSGSSPAIFPAGRSCRA